MKNLERKFSSSSEILIDTIHHLRQSSSVIENLTKLIYHIDKDNLSKEQENLISLIDSEIDKIKFLEKRAYDWMKRKDQ